jgi:threonine synthase
VGAALRELQRVGLIDRVPRVVSVQAAGAAPFARAFGEGFGTRHRVAAQTVASAIRIGDPASWDRGVRTITETHGVVVAVTDAEIMAAKQVVDRAGIGCEPASAATVAGIRSLVSAGTIGRGQSVVAILTGHVLKDPAAIELADRQSVEVDADASALRTELRGIIG